MRISPFDFYEMTIAEVILAQKGYMDDKELTANLTLMAVAQGNSKKPKLFDFSSKEKSENGVGKSTIEDRKETFDALQEF